MPIKRCVSVGLDIGIELTMIGFVYRIFPVRRIWFFSEIFMFWVFTWSGGRRALSREGIEFGVNCASQCQREF